MWQQGEHFACAKTNGTKRPQCHVRETTSDGIPKSRRFLERWRRGLLRRERASWEASASRSGGGNNRWREIVRTGMAGGFGESGGNGVCERPGSEGEVRRLEGDVKKKEGACGGGGVGKEGRNPLLERERGD